MPFVLALLNRLARGGVDKESALATECEPIPEPRGKLELLSDLSLDISMLESSNDASEELATNAESPRVDLFCETSGSTVPSEILRYVQKQS